MEAMEQMEALEQMGAPEALEQMNSKEFIYSIGLKYLEGLYIAVFKFQKQYFDRGDVLRVSFTQKHGIYYITAKILTNNNTTELYNVFASWDDYHDFFYRTILKEQNEALYLLVSKFDDPLPFDVVSSIIDQLQSNEVFRNYKKVVYQNKSYIVVKAIE